MKKLNNILLLGYCSAYFLRAFYFINLVQFPYYFSDKEIKVEQEDESKFISNIVFGKGRHIIPNSKSLLVLDEINLNNFIFVKSQTIIVCCFERSKKYFLNFYANYNNKSPPSNILA